LSAIFLPTLIANTIVFGDHRPRLRAAILLCLVQLNIARDAPRLLGLAI